MRGIATATSKRSTSAVVSLGMSRSKRRRDSWWTAALVRHGGCVRACRHESSPFGYAFARDLRSRISLSHFQKKVRNGAWARASGLWAAGTRPVSCAPDRRIGLRRAGHGPSAVHRRVVISRGSVRGSDQGCAGSTTRRRSFEHASEAPGRPRTGRVLRQGRLNWAQPRSDPRLRIDE